MNARSIRIIAVTLAFAVTLATVIAGVAFVRKVEEVPLAKPIGPVAFYTFDGARIVRR